MVTNSCTHREGGQHRYEATESGARRYCVDCGDPEFSTAGLGPVRLPTREEIMADSRRARWMPLTHLPGPPHDRSYVVGCYRRVSIEGTLKMVWYMRQVMPDEGGEPLVFSHPATHWAEDVSGSPMA